MVDGKVYDTAIARLLARYCWREDDATVQSDLYQTRRGDLFAVHHGQPVDAFGDDGPLLEPVTRAMVAGWAPALAFRWRAAPALEVRDPAQLRAIAQARHGEKWQSALARDLGVSATMISLWARGRPIPPWAEQRLAQLAAAA